MKLLLGVLLASCVACSSTQKTLSEANQNTTQRIPLADKKKNEKKLSLAEQQAILNAQKAIQAITMTLAKAVEQVALPGNIIIPQPEAQRDQYMAPIFLGGAGLLAVGTLSTVLATTLAAPALASTAAISFLLGKQTALGLIAATGLTGTIVTSVKSLPGSKSSWPHRFKIVYRGYMGVLKLDNLKIEGHCSAYFYSSTDHPDQATLLKQDDKVVGFTAPFEIDGCTHEDVFPENKPGQLRVGEIAGPTDVLLGQHRVTAYGKIEVRFVEPDKVAASDKSKADKSSATDKTVADTAKADKLIEPDQPIAMTVKSKLVFESHKDLPNITTKL